MENAKIITIKELVNEGRAVTGASSLFSSAASHSSSESTCKNPQSRTGAVDSDFSHKFLVPLNHPAVIVGTLALPSETLKCPNRYCFRFSDGDLTICCDILGFEVRAIGSKICVLSWNFLPMKRCGGFLEIIKWKFVDSGNLLSRCSGIGSFPLIPSLFSSQNGDRKSRYSVHGVFESVSPVSVVSCQEGASSNSVNLPGGQEIAASSMDMRMIEHLEREQCVEMETTGLNLQNVWGNEVCQVDPLVRAWSLLQGLLNS